MRCAAKLNELNNADEPALIEYVVVHELVHLTVKSHSPDFWGLVSSALPDAQERRRRLREAGRMLPL